MRMPKPDCYRVVEWGRSGFLRPKYQQCLRIQEKQALKIVRFQRRLRLAISFYVLQDHRGSSSAVGLLRLVLRSDRQHQ